MNSLSSRRWLFRLVIIVAVALEVATCLSAAAQTNAWTNPASGNWQDAQWSLGVLPGPSQDIQLTNVGWKAVGIQPSTTAGFQETLNINSLTIASPADSLNELLLNYSGTQTPLVIGGSNNPGSLFVGPGAAIVILASGLKVQNAITSDGSEQGAFLIGGAFTETQGSQVNAGFLDLEGTYNLTNSLLSVGTENLSGLAIFNQQGGTNNAKLLCSGNYNLFDGALGGTILLMSGQFNQWGGEVRSSLNLVNGQYRLAGGMLACGACSIPSSGGLSSTPFSVSFLQTGGTNAAGTVSIGYTENTTGSYTFSGGVLDVSNLSVGPTEFRLGFNGNSFSQSGGYNTSGSVSIVGGSFPFDGTTTIALSSYSLSGGTLVTPSMSLAMGTVQQSGGTNQVGTLSLTSGSSYFLSGGELTARDLQINGSFHHTGGSLSIPDVVTFNGATWGEQTGGEQLGRLAVTSSNVLALAQSNACLLQFADSSSLLWSNAPSLRIDGWSGSFYGGGRHRLVFGNSTAALSAQQVGAIHFHNPAGMAAGDYPARILSDGEVVPDSGHPLPLVLTDLSQTNGAIRLTIGGDIGRQYGLETSTDLQHWILLTNQWNSNGTLVVSDSKATNAPVHFYRAVLVQ